MECNILCKEEKAGELVFFLYQIVINKIWAKHRLLVIVHEALKAIEIIQFRARIH
jgi:hypothetical protein